MIKNKLTLILAFSVVSSCSSIMQNSNYFPIIADFPAKIYKSFKSNELTQEYIDGRDISFAHVFLGNKEAIFVLKSIDNEIYHWVGNDGISLYTFQGLIIKTIGLEHNVELIKPKELSNLVQNNINHLFKINFDKPKISELPIYIQQIGDEDFSEYKIHSNLIGWNGKIFLESKNGIPQKLTQNIHPFLEEIRVSYYFKYK